MKSSKFEKGGKKPPKRIAVRGGEEWEAVMMATEPKGIGEVDRPEFK